jgi:BlaR1 peptidase M56
MTDVTDRWVVPWITSLADWSLRWGVLLAALALWLTVRPPRRAAIRHLLCTIALTTGVLMPLMPRWWNAGVPWTSQKEVATVSEPSPPQHSTGLSSGSIALEPARVWHADRGGAVISERALPAVPLRRALGPWRLAVLIFAAAWATIVLALSARLIGGRVVLSRLRRSALEVDEASLRLLDDCRNALGLSRLAALASHPAVGTPVALGGWRPLILVPLDWNTWPNSQKRACLLHELTHLAHRDDWAKLIQEVIRVPFFFHPLVIWLLARLDRERELLCDEAVVALGTEPVGYARLLLDLARRPARLLPGAAACRPGWLPFLDRRTVAVRIERLLEDDMMRYLSPPTARRMFALGTLAIAAALGIGGLRVHAVEPQAKGIVQPAPRTEPATAARTIEATILDPDGKPVADAVIVAGFEHSGKSNHRVFKTDADGRFSWPMPDGPVSSYFVAHKEGFTPAIWSRYLPAGERCDGFELKLGKQESFTAVLVDTAGQPLAGARVRIEMFAYGSTSPTDRPGITSTTVCYTYMTGDIIAGSPLADLFETTSDRDGSFTFRACPLNARLKLGVTGRGGAELRVRADGQRENLLESMMTDMNFVAAPPRVTTRLVSFPAARIEGRVTTTLPRVSVGGLVVWIQGSNPVRGKLRSEANTGLHSVQTDQDGRFVIDGLNEGTVNVFVEGAGEREIWTYCAARDVALKPGETAEVAFDLIRGVEVEGKVVARGGGEPVEAAQVGVYGPYRPRSGASTIAAKTDAQGRYHYRLPPGETYFYICGPPAGYARLADDGSSQTVIIPDGAARYEVPPLEIAPAVTVRGRVLDAAGSPVIGAKIVGICKGSQCVPLPGTEALTDSQGEFRLPNGYYNTIPIGQTARLLIRLRDGVEHEADALPAADGEVTVKLAASGKPIGVPPAAPR